MLALFSLLTGGYSAARLFSTDADSHDDFKPQVKAAAAAGDVEATIEKDVGSHDVFIYMKVLRVVVAPGARTVRRDQPPVGGTRFAALLRWLRTSSCATHAGSWALKAPPPWAPPCCTAGCAPGPDVRLQQHGLRHTEPIRCAGHMHGRIA